LDLDPIGSRSRSGWLLLAVEKPWTPRVVQHCVSENCSLCSTKLYVPGSTYYKQSDLSKRLDLRIGPANRIALLSEGMECVCYQRRLRERDPVWSTPRIDFSTLARARAVCAFTVPMGTPRTRAVSQTER